MKKILITQVLIMLGIGLCAQQQMEVEGAIKLGTTTNNDPGTIRYNGSDFEGHDGASWKSLTATGGTTDEIVDGDMDTRVYLSEASEDAIYFDLDGLWGFKMQRNAYGDAILEGLNTALHGNLFVGRESGFNTTNNFNTSFGHRAMKANTTGSQNTAVGEEALYSNTTGAWNTAVGRQALYSNVGGTANTAIGWKALTSNTSGINNTAVGHLTLGSNTTGSGNTALGKHALDTNTTGDRNIAVGQLALTVNSTGNDNIAVGFSALNSNSTGIENVAIGNNAMLNNLTASRCVAIGHEALRDYNSTNILAHNVAIGFESLKTTSSGTQNTAVGSKALSSNNGNSNVAVGDGALRDNNGSSNVALGTSALLTIDSGNNNTAIGTSAGYSDDLNSSNNTYIGYRAGADAAVSSTIKNDNVMIGYQSGSQNDGDKNIFVGYESGKSITGSNKLLIDNNDATSTSAFIYGEMDNEYLQFNADLNVLDRIGVGTNNPLSDLDLAKSSADIRFSNSSNSAIKWFEAGIEKAYLTHNTSNNVVLANNDTSGDIIVDAQDDVFLQTNGVTKLSVYNDGEVRVQDFLRIIPRASAPTCIDGRVYYNSGDDKLKVCSNGSWQNLN